MATGVRDFPRIGLSAWIDSQIENTDPGVPLYAVGRAADVVRNVLQSEDRTSVLLANTFWQSYVNSTAFVRDLVYYGIDPRAAHNQEILVVSHGTDRFSLLLTDPKLSEGAVRSFVMTASRDELQDGWERTFGKVFKFPRVIREEIPGLPFLAPSQTLYEVYPTQQFTVVLTAPLEEELTHVPSPHAPVDVSVGTSTAGVYVKDAIGRIGVTASLHSVPFGATVTVEGLPGTVVSTDSITDSCFIHVPGIIPRGKTSRGPLRLSPRLHETVTFEGYSTTSGSTRIVAWNYELPYIDPNLQQTVRTDLITARGDSGAALLDSSDYIVGFAHSRSASNIVQAYSSWIWADAVLQAHSLSIY